MVATEVTALSAVLTSAKTALDITKTMFGLRDSALIQEKAVELRSVIMDVQERAFTAQEAQASLSQTKRELEEELMRLKDWTREKENYSLQRLESGAFVYAFNGTVPSTAPEHQLCTTCFERHQKSILQPETRSPGMNTFLVCHNCNSEIVERGFVHHEAPRGPRPQTRMPPRRF